MCNKPDSVLTEHPTLEEFCRSYLGHEIPAYMKPLLSLLDTASEDKIKLDIAPLRIRAYGKTHYLRFLRQLEEAKCAAKSPV